MTYNRNLWSMPALFVEYENTTWVEGGQTISFRVVNHGQPTTSATHFFPAEAKGVISLLEAAGVPTRERVRGEPEKPRFKR